MSAVTHPPFTRVRRRSAAAVGEVALIASIRRWLGAASPAAPFGIGDDCAVTHLRGSSVLTTTDPVIYGLHFDDRVAPADVGSKLLKRNLSDIAAMGGRPTAAVVSLALAPETRLDWLRAFFRGLARCARRHRTAIVGGDVSAAPPGFFGAFLTLNGEPTGKRILTRRGSRLGDALYVTGRLGGSGTRHHHAFTPRLAEGAWLAGRREVRAMMDVSDGLAKDVAALTPPGLVASIPMEAVPVSAAARESARRSGGDPRRHALTDGEDFELLFSVDGRADLRKFEAEWKRRFRRPVYRLGRFARRCRPGDVDWTSVHGFEHLASNPSPDR